MLKPSRSKADYKEPFSSAKIEEKVIQALNELGTSPSPDNSSAEPAMTSKDLIVNVLFALCMLTHPVSGGIILYFGNKTFASKVDEFAMAMGQALKLEKLRSMAKLKIDGMLADFMAKPND